MIWIPVVIILASLIAMPIENKHPDRSLALWIVIVACFAVLFVHALLLKQ